MKCNTDIKKTIAYTMLDYIDSVLSNQQEQARAMRKDGAGEEDAPLLVVIHTTAHLSAEIENAKKTLSQIVNNKV